MSRWTHRRASETSVAADARLSVEAAGARSVAIGGGLDGIVSTGSGATNLQVRAGQAVVLPPAALLPPSQVDAPPSLVNLPVRPGIFVGRGDPLERLDAYVAAPGEAVVQAIHGLGGIGKSILAARWAAGRAGDFNPVWWITADTPAAIDAGLVRLSVALQPELGGFLPFEALRERAVQWLSCHQDWLLVLDNVTDPADITALLARVSSGRFLITSRRATGWAGIAATIRLEVLDVDEAVEVALAILRDHTVEPDLPGIAEVCAELGCLPLAIEQAAAFMAQAGVTPRDYLSMLAAYPATMYATAAEGHNVERTVARIWRVTLDRFADEPLTAHVLRVLAWYASEAIPRTLLDGLAEPPAVARAVGRLAAYNMLSTNVDVGTVALHRLVQAVARTSDLGDPHRQARDIEAARHFAADALVAALPADRHDQASWPAYRAMLPHLEAFAGSTGECTDSRTGVLLIVLGAFLREQGAVHRAVRHLERGVAAVQDGGGHDDHSVLGAQTLLAHAYLSAGNLERAVSLQERILTETRRIAGDDHPNTVIAASNLAAAYQTAGNLKRAIPLLERALTDSHRLHGEDHPLTLTVANNLAAAHQAKGDLRLAIGLQEKIITQSRRVLGDNHPDTLIAENNLAYALTQAGELDRAMALLEKTLEARRRVLGDDHPATLISANDFAGVYESAGELRRAILLYKRVHADRVRVLGGDHPDTLISANDLAHTYARVGNLGRAIPLHEKTLAARRRVLGDEHPDTLQSANNLADAYTTAGRLAAAIPLHERTFADRRRILGEHHPQTLISAGNLASVYYLDGQPDRALIVAKRAYSKALRAGDPDHPQVLKLAQLLTVLSKPGRAANPRDNQ